MLFLRENSQQLASFKFIECHWPMIRLIFTYFIKKGIISAPLLAHAIIGQRGSRPFWPPSSGMTGYSSLAYRHVSWCIVQHYDYHDIPWCTMVYHCTPWYCTIGYGHLPLCTIVCHGTPGCDTTEHSGTVLWLPRLTMVQHCTLWYYTLGYGHLAWCTIVYHVTPWCRTTIYITNVYYRGEPWCTVVYHGNTVLYHGNIVVYHVVIFWLGIYGSFDHRWSSTRPRIFAHALHFNIAANKLQTRVLVFHNLTTFAQNYQLHLQLLAT